MGYGVCTLCFLVRGSEVLLGMKKRGFGEGKWNGFGGRLELGESVEQANFREVREEAGVRLLECEKVAELEFVFPFKREWNQVVHVFIAGKWNGDVVESEEMMPQWFDKNFLPFESMWDDDSKWLPGVLNGRKIVGKFVFKQDNNAVESFELREVVSWT